MSSDKPINVEKSNFLLKMMKIPGSSNVATNSKDSTSKIIAVPEIEKPIPVIEVVKTKDEPNPPIIEHTAHKVVMERNIAVNVESKNLVYSKDRFLAIYQNMKWKKIACPVEILDSFRDWPKIGDPKLPADVLSSMSNDVKYTNAETALNPKTVVMGVKGDKLRGKIDDNKPFKKEPLPDKRKPHEVARVGIRPQEVSAIKGNWVSDDRTLKEDFNFMSGMKDPMIQVGESISSSKAPMRSRADEFEEERQRMRQLAASAGNGSSKVPVVDSYHAETDAIMAELQGLSHQSPVERGRPVVAPVTVSPVELTPPANLNSGIELFPEASTLEPSRLLESVNFEEMLLSYDTKQSHSSGLSLFGGSLGLSFGGPAVSNDHVDWSLLNNSSVLGEIGKESSQSAPSSRILNWAAPVTTTSAVPEPVVEIPKLSNTLSTPIPVDAPLPEKVVETFVQPVSQMVASPSRVKGTRVDVSSLFKPKVNSASENRNLLLSKLGISGSAAPSTHTESKITAVHPDPVSTSTPAKPQADQSNVEDSTSPFNFHQRPATVGNSASKPKAKVSAASMLLKQQKVGVSTK